MGTPLWRKRLPSLNLDFRGGGSLDPRITFSRQVGATYGATRVNASGLIESLSANYALNSDFKLGTVAGSPGTQPTSWTVGVAPTGCTRRIDFGTDQYGDYLEVEYSGTNSSGSTQFPAVFPAAGAHSATGVGVAWVGSARVALLAGAWPTAANIQMVEYDAGFGFLRATSTDITTLVTGPVPVALERNATTGASAAYVTICPVAFTVNNGTPFNCTFRIYSPKLELGSVATPYNRATTAPSGTPRLDYDPVTLAPRGLLIEEQRINLASPSVAPTTVTGGSFPGGGATLLGVAATRYLADGAGGSHFCTFPLSATLPAGSTVHTLSGYFKMVAGTRIQLFLSANIAAVDCYININNGVVVGGGVGASNAFCIHQGNGVYRAGFTFTTIASPINGFPFALSVSYSDGDGRVPAGVSTDSWDCFGGQLEPGAFATSYIPTTAAAVTRAADVASMTGTNFSNWFNATEGAFVCSFDYPPATFGTGGSSNCMLTSGGSARYIYGGNSNNTLRSYDGSTILSSTTVCTGGIAKKAASGYTRLTSRSLSVGGETVVTGSCAAAFTAGTVLYIGSDDGTNKNLNGHIQRLTYYNKRLPDATLKALST